jgi:hypothetical protein
MELRYCENCGDIIQLKADAPPSSSDHFLCDKCRAQESGAPREPQEGSPQLQLKEILGSEELNLFSKGTLVLRKKEMEKLKEKEKAKEAAARAQGQKTQPVYDPHVRGSGSQRVRKAQPQQGLPQQGRPQQGLPQQGLPQQGLPQQNPGGGGPLVGSSAPASRAQKIVFSCPQCKSPFSIRPVATTSRLACPSCRRPFYVTISGQLFSTPPSSAVGKVVKKKGGSVRVVRSQQQPAAAGHLPGPERLAAPAPKAAPAPARKAAGANLESASLVKSNPKGDSDPQHPGRKKPVKSAFDEHLDSDDPDKTCFLTEQETGELRDVALGDEDTFMERLGLKEAPKSQPTGEAQGAQESSVDAFLKEEGELDLWRDGTSPPGSPHDPGSPAAGARSASQRARQSPASGRPGKRPRLWAIRAFAGYMVRAIVVSVSLTAPLLVLAGFQGKYATAEGPGSGSVTASASSPGAPGSVGKRALTAPVVFEALGEETRAGLENLLETVGVGAKTDW